MQELCLLQTEYLKPSSKEKLYGNQLMCPEKFCLNKTPKLALALEYLSAQS